MRVTKVTRIGIWYRFGFASVHVAREVIDLQMNFYVKRTVLYFTV